MTQEELNKIIAKARLCNRIQEVEAIENLYLRTVDRLIENPGRIIDIIHLDNENVIIYIPDNVRIVSFSKIGIIEKLTGAHIKNIKIIGGGKNLIVTTEMLDSLGKSKSLDMLDLSELDMHKVFQIDRMLSNIKVKTLILSKNMPTKVFNATEMFYQSNIKNIIGLEEFRCSIDRTTDMFKGLTCNKLDISKLGRIELSDIKYLNTDKLIVSRNNIQDEFYESIYFLHKSYEYDIDEVVIV